MKTHLACLLFLVLPAAFVCAQDPAAMAPADAGVFIEVHDISTLCENWEDDPMLAKLQDNLPDGKNPEAWEFIQAALDMTGPEIFDTYFSRQLIVIAERPGDGQPAVLLTRIDPKDAARVIDGLMLLKTHTVADFDIYEPEDGSSRIAFGGQWMAITDQWHEPFLLHVLESMADGDRLSDDPVYQAWTAKLPADRQMTAFVREDDDVHALAMSSDEEQLTMNYAGKAGRFAKLIAMLGSPDALTLAPAPDDAIMAIALNIYDPNPRNTIFIDRLLTPHTFKDDVLPGLGAPLVMWISEDPTDAAALPGMGMAVRLNDDSVTGLLDRMFESLVTFANIAGFQWGMPPFLAVEKTVGDQTYMHAEIGDALAQRFGVSMLNNADFVFGQAGDWYVLTTHPSLMENAIHSADQPQAETPDDGRQPVMRMRLSSQAATGHLHRLANQLEDNVPAPAGKIDKLADWFGYYSRVEMSLDVDDEGIFYGSMQVTRP